jgi:hypothetical protein
MRLEPAAMDTVLIDRADLAGASAVDTIVLVAGERTIHGYETVLSYAQTAMRRAFAPQQLRPSQSFVKR